jgi:hypothetical protein
MKTLDGGPAFPAVRFADSGDKGMSMRQWYQGMALQGLLAKGVPVLDAVRLAKGAAIAMLRDDEPEADQ